MIINAYFPSCSIMIMTVVPLYLNESMHFGTSVTLVLTAFLCLFSLFQSSLSDVPKTAYVKFIDHWNLLAMIVPLLNFFILLFLEICGSHISFKVGPKYWKWIRIFLKSLTPVATVLGVVTYSIIAYSYYSRHSYEMIM